MSVLVKQHLDHLKSSKHPRGRGTHSPAANADFT